MTTMCLPFAAGRDVGSTGRFVPLSPRWVCTLAAVSAALLLPLDPDFELDDELLSDEPQATTVRFAAAKSAAKRTTAERVMQVPLALAIAHPGSTAAVTLLLRVE